jgi:hypothetical protein
MNSDILSIIAIVLSGISIMISICVIKNSRIVPERRIEAAIKAIPRWTRILLIILLCAIVFIWAMLIFQDKYGFEIYNYHTSIILAFVGILATFVVVGNYVQVGDIERKFEARVTKMEEIFDGRIRAVNAGASRETAVNLKTKCTAAKEAAEYLYAPHEEPDDLDTPEKYNSAVNRAKEDIDELNRALSIRAFLLDREIAGAFNSLADIIGGAINKFVRGRLGTQPGTDRWEAMIQAELDLHKQIFEDKIPPMEKNLNDLLHQAYGGKSNKSFGDKV